MQAWIAEETPECLAHAAAVSKRARTEVSLKTLTPKEVRLFDEAQQNELQCWISTTALRRSYSWESYIEIRKLV